jgi:transposase-like protein
MTDQVKKERRTFTKEYKVSAVQLCKEVGISRAAATLEVGQDLPVQVEEGALK